MTINEETVGTKGRGKAELMESWIELYVLVHNENKLHNHSKLRVKTKLNGRLKKGLNKG